jgi:hypothetical protein
VTLQTGREWKQCRHTGFGTQHGEIGTPKIDFEPVISSGQIDIPSVEKTPVHLGPVHSLRYATTDQFIAQRSEFSGRQYRLGEHPITRLKAELKAFSDP